jgi:AraC-like DNA-binding protein
MNILYREEHFSCLNYYKDEKSLVNIEHLKKGEKRNYSFETNYIAIITKGEFEFSCGSHVNVIAKEKQMIVVPVNKSCTVNVLSDSTILTIRLNIDLSFCDHLSFKMLLENELVENSKAKKNYVKILTINKRIKSYLVNLVNYIEDGLQCSYLLEMKIKELLFILRAYYSKEDLYGFFRPILNNDLMFSVKIHQYYKNSSTVNELAKLMNYSISGFEKKFKKVFCMATSKWLQNKRAQNIYHEINCTSKTFSEMSYEYGFSSPAHFNLFCKKQFGESPGNIRKKNQEK